MYSAHAMLYRGREPVCPEPAQDAFRISGVAAIPAAICELGRQD